MPLFSTYQDSMFIVYNKSSDTNKQGSIQIYHTIFKLNIDKYEKLDTRLERQIYFDDTLVTENLSDMPYVGLSGDINKINVKTCTAEVIKNTNISWIFMVDDNHCYVLVCN